MPLEMSSPLNRIFCPFFTCFFMPIVEELSLVDFRSTSSVSSNCTTALAPSGTEAPVIIRMAVLDVTVLFDR